MTVKLMNKLKEFFNYSREMQTLLRNFLTKDLGRRKGWKKNFLRVIKDYERFTLIQIANPFDQFIESCRERFKTIELIVT